MPTIFFLATFGGIVLISDAKHIYRWTTRKTRKTDAQWCAAHLLKVAQRH